MLTKKSREGKSVQNIQARKGFYSVREKVEEQKPMLGWGKKSFIA